MSNKAFSRRDFLRMSVVATAGAALAGCARPADEPQVVKETVEVPVKETVEVEVEKTVIVEPTEPAPPVMEGSIVIWAYPETDDDMGLIYNPLNDEFNEQYPDIKVSVDVQPWGGRREALYAALAAGDPPDIWWASSDTIQAYYEKRVAAPLTGLIPEELLAQYTDNDIAVCTFQNELLIAPYTKQIMGYWHNARLMEECGFDPEVGVSTWDEILALGEAAKANGWYVDGVDTYWWLDWLGWMRMAGGNVYSEDGTEVRLREEPCVETLSFWVTLFEEGYVPKEGASGSAEESAMLPDYFSQEEQVTSEWIHCVQYAEQFPDFPLVLSPPRKKDEGYEPVAGSEDYRGWAITAGSEQKEVALQWIKFMIEPENTGAFCTAAGSSVPAGTESKRFWETDACIIEAAEEIEPYTWVNQDNRWYWQESKVICAPHFQSAVLGLASVEEALDAAATELEAMIVERQSS